TEVLLAAKHRPEGARRLNSEEPVFTSERLTDELLFLGRSLWHGRTPRSIIDATTRGLPRRVVLAVAAGSVSPRNRGGRREAAGEFGEVTVERIVQGTNRYRQLRAQLARAAVLA